MFRVFFLIIIFMDNERGYKCENWLVQRVHSYELTSSTNELLHFVIEP